MAVMCAQRNLQYGGIAADVISVVSCQNRYNGSWAAEDPISTEECQEAGGEEEAWK